MKMSKVGNQTNSQDPQAVNSRIFVGNLNTFQCSKTDVERMFQRYGRLAGISMHKGFAFIQFTNPFDARSACLGEDGRTVLGQTLAFVFTPTTSVSSCTILYGAARLLVSIAALWLITTLYSRALTEEETIRGGSEVDVNLVAEPKPHQTGRKRPNLGKTGNDWDYFYDSYYASVFPSLRVPHPPSSKRARLMLTNPARPQIIAQLPRKQSPTLTHQQPQQQIQQPNHLQEELPYIISQLKTYSNPDILICGNCRELFSELEELLQHKKTYCKLRFTCKCNNVALANFNDKNGSEDKISLLCVECKDSFDSAWDLIVHVQAAHMMNVYELGTPKSKNDQLSPQSSDHTVENGFSDNKSDTEKTNSDTDRQSPPTIGQGNNQTMRSLGNCFMLSDKSVVYTAISNENQ